MIEQTIKSPRADKISGQSLESLAASEEGIRLLKEAFSSFNRATARLERSYQDLERRVQCLDRALEEKNRELERNLGETEKVRNYLHNILESLHSGVLVLDPTGKITTGNDAVRTITGHNSTDVVGCSISDLGIFNEALAEHLNRVVAHPSQGCDCETQIIRRDGGFLHVHLSSSPMKDTRNRISGQVIVLQDIERLKALEEQAQRTGRLSAMGEMAARIAHEIRNPLGSIELFASILRRELEGERKRLAEHVINGVKTLNMVITNLLYFFRGSLEPTRTELDFHGFLSDFLAEMSQVMEKNRVTFETDFPPKPITLWGDPELIKQLFLNLLLNAIQAMPKGGKIEIATRLIRERVEILTPEYADSPLAVFLEVRVSDTGHGIPDEIRSRIFDPFFTTRDKGAGLGLAIAHNIMEAHGGTIRVASGRHQGATLLMTFPLNDGVKDREKDRPKGVVDDGKEPDSCGG
jgi:PAS domain S-box-containing protein